MLMVPLLVVQGACGKEITLNENNNGSQLTVAVGDTVLVRLKSRLATGYSWSPSFDATILSVTKLPLDRSSGESGITEHQIFRIRFLKQGNTQILFDYKRVWETDVPPQSRIKYSFTIR
jgi:predicted secreted protein